jgi:hypothetical protein
MSDLSILARGEADELERELFDRRALATVRYADPAAWTVATAAARAIAAAREAVTAAGDAIGVLVTSPRGPVETIAAVAQAAREGFSSPLRYPASNPGSLAGVTCIALGLRGPTLMLTMPPLEGAPLGLLLGGRWIERGDVPLVVVAACRERSPGKHTARCLLLGRAAAGADGGSIDRARDGAWLAGSVAVEAARAAE